MANTPGSLNDPLGSPAQIGTNNYELKPYSVPNYQLGQWQISSLDPDACAITDQQRQELYVAESLNISGAPINVFKLLGIHEQDQNSLLQSAAIISSQSYPGYPTNNLLTNLPWRSLQTGNNIPGNVYLGLDFGNKTYKETPKLEYAPAKPNYTKVGSVKLIQSNTADFAKQVKVEITDGECEIAGQNYSGIGNGQLNLVQMGPSIQPMRITLIATSSSVFNATAYLSNNTVINLGQVSVNSVFNHPFISFKIASSSIEFSAGDIFTISISYKWKRHSIHNLVQTSSEQILNLNTVLLVKAIRIVPTLFNGNGNWEVLKFDASSTVATSVDNIQDLFFGENRDRDYSLEPLLIKAQYSPADSVSDLSRFGLNILDQYAFTVAFSSMIKALGRPIVIGDIIEVIPEMQYDHNLKPIRKYLEVTDTGWAAEGFSTAWKPTVFRFSAQQALPSQETKDIFGTIDTQKYMIADSILSNNIGSQIDVTPLTQTEEIKKEASALVPEIGSDETIAIENVKLNPVLPPQNTKGQPPASVKPGVQAARIEDGLPPNGVEYTEGYKLPDTNTSTDGEYFRLYYPTETNIPPRLYRFSSIKNKWIFQETDRRGEYSSHKPSVRSILQSSTKQSISGKTT